MFFGVRRRLRDIYIKQKIRRMNTGQRIVLLHMAILRLEQIQEDDQNLTAEQKQRFSNAIWDYRQEISRLQKIH
jgi:hypothetical protein